jgi:hypothetical protein
MPPKFDFAKVDHAGLSAALLTVDWRCHFSSTDSIDTAWDNFSKIIISLITQFTPLKKPLRDRKAPYLPSNILHLIKLKHKAWKQYKKHINISNKKTFIV